VKNALSNLNDLRMKDTNLDNEVKFLNEESLKFSRSSGNS
jgi:hypothetical protein